MSSPKPLRIYVLPVSGSLFPAQMGLLAAVAAANSLARARGDGAPPDEERPDIVLASSGGNLAAYAGLSADWARERIYKVADILKSGSFLAPWSDALPSWLFLPVAHSVFRPGYGVRDVFRFLFTAASLRDTPTEVWTGTFHRATGQQRLFTNKARGETLLAPFRSGEASDDAGKLHLGVDTRSVYAAGSRRVLAKASLASASIPWLVQPVRIHGELYSDGGSLYASPLTAVDADVAALALPPSARTLRLVYFSPETLTQPRDVSESIMGEIKNLLFSSSSCDIRAFINLIVRLGAPSPAPERHPRLDAAAFADVLVALDATARHYAVILYPESATIDNTLDLENLRPIDIRRVMARVEASFGAFVWVAAP